MIAHRFQTESPTWPRRYDLGTTPLAVSPDTECVTALTCVQGTGCGTLLSNIWLTARADVPVPDPEVRKIVAPVSSPSPASDRAWMETDEAHARCELVGLWPAVHPIAGKRSR